MGINTMNNTMITFGVIGFILDDDEYLKLKKEFKDVFEESDIQEYLEAEVAALKKTNSPSLKENRSKYIRHLIWNLKEFLTSMRENKELAKVELDNFKIKVDAIVDLSLEGKMKASVERLIVVQNNAVERSHRGKPFYVDEKWKLRVAIAGDFNLEPIKDLENPEEVANTLNKNYMYVKNLIEESVWDVKEQVWMLYDIVANPEKLPIYELELKNQPWYEKKSKELLGS